MTESKGSFTLPGESGYEALTLKMAQKWGADVIRDSDGTALSDEILQAGYGIYSTICIIRDHNEWAKRNPDKLQQTFLSTMPAVATEPTLRLELMKDFFSEQFKVNDTPAALKYFQVCDRTTGEPVDPREWRYADGAVTLTAAIPFHRYSASFLAYRIWEEISMYNHTTNHWDKEHLMQIDPRHEAVRTYMRQWLTDWCESHPATTVVRFTSLFYNFVWIWGSSERCRNLFSDWGSYDFTVSEKALDEFAEAYGYSLTAEDFIHGGKLHVTHAPPTPHQRDWMAFIQKFVASFGRELVDIVHRYGKKAYVFYDDSWVGLEPYNGHFRDFGFDGLIKCVFSGYEARLCAGADVETHELRLHPYLFPVGLGGAPTFAPGGDPATDARRYWISVRRALLRQPVDRIGLGGYLHLTEDFPEFRDCIAEIADEFRRIKELHQAGKPLTLKPRVAVLHAWGKLRSWTLSGHFHETGIHDLIHINEALAGLPLEVGFIAFEDVPAGALADYDVVINAGYAGSAWSGGAAWENPELVTQLTRWVYDGGVFLGVNEPSAAPGGDTCFRMAHVLGGDEDTGDRVCHGRWQFEVLPVPGVIPAGAAVHAKPNRFLTDGKARVFCAENGVPSFTINEFGRGKGVYLGDFTYSAANAKLLLNTILHATGESLDQPGTTDNPATECAWYPASRTLVVVNNSEKAQTATVHSASGSLPLTLQPFETLIY